jgi:hypothetical protein
LALLRDEQAPRELAARLFDALADSASAPSRRWSAPSGGKLAIAGAAGLIAASIAAIYWWRAVYIPREQARQFAALMLKDHLKMSAKADPLQLVSSDPERITDWLRQHVLLGLRPPRLGEASLLGARRCQLGQHKVALIFYDLAPRNNGPTKRPQRLASLFVLDAGEADFSGMVQVPLPDRHRLWRYQELGLTLLIWQERGLTYALASDLDESALVERLPRGAK